MELRIAGINDDSVVDGDGVRLTVFTQGCLHHCPGCQNPETHAVAGGYIIDTDDILARLASNPLLSGVTFSGGEPFLQPIPLAALAQQVHAKGLDIWTYTGFTLEELISQHNQAITMLLQEIDVLVDGRYDDTQRDLTLHFRGSKNQRVIDLAKWRRDQKIHLLYTN